MKTPSEMTDEEIEQELAILHEDMRDERLYGSGVVVSNSYMRKVNRSSDLIREKNSRKEKSE